MKYVTASGIFLCFMAPYLAGCGVSVGNKVLPAPQAPPKPQIVYVQQPAAQAIVPPQTTFESRITGFGSGETLQEAENAAFEDMARKTRLLNMNVVAVSSGSGKIPAAKSLTAKPRYSGTMSFTVTTSSAQCATTPTEPTAKSTETANK